MSLSVTGIPALAKFFYSLMIIQNKAIKQPPKTVTPHCSKAHDCIDLKHKYSHKYSQV